ncbi:hypothetical protein [uncultured Holdemanella sp.]|uniref:hypothetical protein n=1 Tax=uncultured Holdemanella sp. TaxID=1763549 RepID=UPI0025E69D3B|nr:hypothetical protein [uncultured Holdemanella sp.]
MVKRRRNSFIVLASALLLTGCGNSELKITENDIFEVARDDANATKKECSNVSINEEKKYYTVSFDTNSGSYEYKIGKDGIIQDRNYKRSETEEETAPVVEQEPVQQEEPTQEEQTTEEENKTEKKETKKEKKQKKFDENQQKAIDAALANAGLAQEDVADIGCELDENSNQYTVTFNFQEIHNTAIVDASSFVVLSSIQG